MNAVRRPPSTPARKRRSPPTPVPLAGAITAFAALLEGAFREQHRIDLPLLPGAANALLAWVCANRLQRTVLVITDSPQQLETFHRDLRVLDGALHPAGEPPASAPAIYYPALETYTSAQKSTDHERIGLRLRALQTLMAMQAGTTPPTGIITTDVHALLQRIPTPETLRDALRHLTPAMACDPTELATYLESRHYSATPEVQQQGQFALRGGILDVWPPDQLWPLRLEFFGTTLESIRTFNPEDQRSLSRPDTVTLTPADNNLSATDEGADLTRFLPPNLVLFWADPDAIDAHVQFQREAYREAGALDALLPLATMTSALEGLTAHTLTPRLAPAGPLAALRAEPFDDINADLISQDPDAQMARRHARLEAVAHEAAEGRQTLVFFDTPGARDHYTTARPDAFKRLPVLLGRLSAGFRADTLNLTIMAESDLYSLRKLSAERYDPLGELARPPRRTGDRLNELGELEPDDLVVHVQHGLGKYRGLLEIEFEGHRQEVISIEYAEGARLHIPATHAHLLSRYVGVSGRKATLHRLGGRRWTREKAAAERAIADMAAGLLETQAQRTVLQGTAFSPDTAWQHEFEAAFPYRETPDQRRVIAEIKSDMEATRPMDRLLCGDAGYGKTEVAMRAAFKAVMDGRQVAMLVPTTVLAQQHFFTFCDRMRAYPIRIAMLSRFCAETDKRATLRGLREGDVDIVIATHSILQERVRFHSLGLAIIDEEQRFGVKDKEKIKEIRRMVDVLTLTATPIPRTLYMSMTGARDLSLLQTAPRERMPIETLVEMNTDHVVRAAVLREIDRGGQVYYLHNRVMTIDLAAQRLRGLLPEARIAVAHGQMPTGQLRQIVRAFVQGDYDVLLCTVIIESGVDIPRANTILIDRADRFGIADLYQLRGRVGRSNHKAYAYLLLPPHGHLDRDARRRIQALQRNSALGTGFQLALQDLEIRGAGNILGAEQSGHITAIGFGLYCQLLKRTVAGLQGERVPPVIDVDIQFDFLDLSPAHADRENCACLPYTYVDDDHLRVENYRRFAELTGETDVADLQRELDDRFGTPPPPVQRLFDIARLRIAAHAAHITAIRIRDGRIRLIRGGEPILHQSRLPTLTTLTTADRLAEIHGLILQNLT